MGSRFYSESSFFSCCKQMDFVSLEFRISMHDNHSCYDNVTLEYDT